VLNQFNSVSPLHARSRIPRSTHKVNESMQIGRGFHSLVLDGLRQFEKSFPVYEGGRRYGAAFDEFCAAHPEADRVDVLNPKAHETILRMHESFQRHEQPTALVHACMPEATMFTTHEPTGLYLKGRPDGTNAEFLIDIKTTAGERFHPRPFRETARLWGYDFQLAAYTLIAQLIGFDIRRGYIIAVERDHPFDITTYTVSRSQLEAKIYDVENALRGYAECMATGIWPGVGLGHELALFPEQAEQTEQDALLENQSEACVELGQLDANSADSTVGRTTTNQQTEQSGPEPESKENRHE
jgi:exodeoxyribonuclease VIII